MNALDTTNTSSCWNSDSGEDTVHFVVDFGRRTTVCRVQLQFQAGFVGQVVSVLLLRDNEKFEQVDEIEPLDNHGLQTFDIDSSKTAIALKLSFSDCTDFYGRVTLYRLEVWGYEEK